MQAGRSLVGSLLVTAWSRMQRDLPATMTGNMKLQHFGVYSLIVLLHGKKQIATNRALAKHTSATYVTVNAITRALTACGLITQTQYKAPHGKGYEYYYEPVYDLEEVDDLVPPTQPERARHSNGARRSGLDSKDGARDE